MGMGVELGSPDSSLIPQSPINFQHLLLLLWKVLYQPFPRGVHLPILCPSCIHSQLLPAIPL